MTTIRRAVRHIMIPDTQIKQGVPLDHLDWAAEAIVDYLPDVIVMIGDWGDVPSLSSYEKPGGLKLEGARVLDDIAVANEAAARFVAPIQKEIARRVNGHRKRWTPRMVYTQGNHEQRLDRIGANDAKLEGLVSSASIVLPGFERHPFLEIVHIDGIAYSHYFANIHSGRPIGGEIVNRLNHIGQSFVQGHEQGFRYGCRQYPGNKRRHGLVGGSFYQQTEDYRGPQGRDEWRGIFVLNEVVDGDFCIMPLTLDYLRKKYS